MFSKNRRDFGYYSFAGLTVSAIALSLAGYLGRLNYLLEFAAGYKLQFLLMALCSLFYFLFTSRKLWIFLSLLCILLNLVEILPWYFNQPQISNSQQYEPLKVFSYNVLWQNKKYDRAIALISQEQPDIAIFQEAVPHWHQKLKALKATYPYHVRAQTLEMEVYSKIPLRQTEIKRYGTYRGLIIVEVRVGDRPVKFIATHAYPQLHFGASGWRIRNEHLKVGIGEYAQKQTQPVIVMGDLNVALWSPFYRSMMQISGLRNARQGLGILPTHSIVAPQIAALAAPIDHCLISEDIGVRDFRLGKAIGSDHLPIIAELLIPQASSKNS